MGCCCSKPSASKDEKSTEMTKNSMHSSKNSCKCGKMGKNIKVHGTDTYFVEGSGIILGSCVLDCDTAYFEVKVGKNPSGVLVGVKRYETKRPSSLEKHLNEDESDPEYPAWYLKSELKENDVVGVHWDQTDLPMLSFTVNGVDVRGDINRVRPANDLFPAVSLNSSSAELIFDESKFNFKPKSKKFNMIICATSLL